MQSTIAHTRLAGPGEPVVLVHGIGHHSPAWGEVPEMLQAKGYDVTVVDLPGHGRSPAPTRPDGYSMRSCAEQLERHFRAHGIDRPHVIGNSLGGIIALELAARGSVRTALALSPAGFYPPHHLVPVGLNLVVMRLGSHLPEAFHRWLNRSAARRRLALRALYVHPEKITPEVALADTMNMRRSAGFWPHFVLAAFLRFTKHVAVPTTVAWGDRDRLLMPSQAGVARRRLPEATHVSLPEAGHCPQIDQPELVVDVAVATFSRSTGAAQGRVVV